MKFDYDVAVIGAGTAGLVSAFVADALGARVALIEADKTGGECLWRGCVPSKTLLRSAKVWELVKRSEEFGIHVEKPRLVWSSVRLRLADVRDEIRRGERDELAKSKITQISGHARFLDDHTLEIEKKSEKRVLSAKKFVLATGSVPKIPAIEGLRASGFLAPHDLFDRPALPKSLIFIGGGPVSCEMAQAFARFGTKTTILQKSAQLLPHDEPEIAAHLLQILRAEGVEIRLNCEISRVETSENRKTVHFQSDGEIQNVAAGEIVLATGKTPRLDDLNLNAAGVEWDEKGLKTDAHLRTTARHIWACGDALGRHFFTHAAEHEAKIAGANAVLPVASPIDDSGLVWVTFTDPEVAHIGLSGAQARQKWSGAKTFRADFKTLDRAIIEGEASGFALVHTSPGGRIVGASIIGPSAGEIVAGLILAVKDGALIGELAETMFPYPTLGEILHRVGNEAYKEVLDSKIVLFGLKLVEKL